MSAYSLVSFQDPIRWYMTDIPLSVPQPPKNHDLVGPFLQVQQMSQ